MVEYEPVPTISIELYNDTKLYNACIAHYEGGKTIKTPIETMWLAKCLQLTLDLEEKGYEEREIPEHTMIEFLPSFDRNRTSNEGR